MVLSQTNPRHTTDLRRHAECLVAVAVRVLYLSYRVVWYSRVYRIIGANINQADGISRVDGVVYGGCCCGCSSSGGVG